MTLSEIKELLKGRVISKNFDPQIEIDFAFASDLMADVLMSPKPGALLITGLASHQAIRTCKIANMSAIVFVRDKNPAPGAIELAENYRIPVLATGFSMLDACGILFSKGIKGVRSKS